MMLVNFQITPRAEVEIEASMARKKLQHMIEEPYASGNGITAAPINVQTNLNVGLRGFSVNAS
jgi:hypothetical protein